MIWQVSMSSLIGTAAERQGHRGRLTEDIHDGQYAVFGVRLMIAVTLTARHNGGDPAYIRALMKRLPWVPVSKIERES